jgi:3-oxoacyl-[acyl-carrier protein] reductase
MPTMHQVPSTELKLPASISLQGRRVLVTGAASGIGQATARALAELGATLVLTDAAPLVATRTQVIELGASCQCIQGDLTDTKFLNEILAVGPYNSLAHCAGIVRSPPGLSESDSFDFIMHINLLAPMKLATACMEQMAARGGGFIVLVGSAAGRHGGTMVSNYSFDYGAYAASKGALHTVVRWLARRAVDKNVLVNGVAPGPVQTPLTAGVAFPSAVLPLGRPGLPEEIGWPIALLCSPAASFMSGAVLDINGGSFVG